MVLTFTRQLNAADIRALLGDHRVTVALAVRQHEDQLLSMLLDWMHSDVPPGMKRRQLEEALGARQTGRGAGCGGEDGERHHSNGVSVGPRHKDGRGARQRYLDSITGTGPNVHNPMPLLPAEVRLRRSDALVML